MDTTASSDILDGQIALVTGASRGIGREIARQLAHAGAKVAVAARSLDALRDTVVVIEREGGVAHAFQMDVGKGEQVEEVIGKIEEAIGPIDLLVNNAGITSSGKAFWELTDKEVRRVLEVNVLGAFRCCRLVVPGMIQRGSGRIINIGSNGGVKPFPFDAAYSISKAALIRLGDNLALQVEEKGIKVFTISPGLVRTEMTRALSEGPGLPDLEWTPIEKAGELCVLLASGQADVLTGRYINCRDDDIHEMIRRSDEIIEKDLHIMTLRI